jgi:hypothetical protein
MSRKVLAALILGGAFFTFAGTANAVKSIELSQLVNTFLLPANSDYALKWSVGATTSSPIKWKTSGIVDGTECHVYKPFCRLGSAVVTVNGKVTHEVLAQTVQPGKWNITISGARVGVSNVSIQSDVNSPDLEFDVPSVLKRAKMKLTPIKCLNDPATSGNTLYKLTAPNKKPAWLLNSWSCGSAGCSSAITIYYYIENTQDIQCLGE